MVEGESGVANPTIRTTILIVDNEYDVRQSVKLQLRKYRPKIRTATGVQDAKRIIEASEEQLLVVLDMALDDRHPSNPRPGFEMLQWMHDMRLLGRCLVLAATGTLDSFDRAMRARNMGVYEVLSKPYDVHSELAPALITMDRRIRRGGRPAFVAESRKMQEVVRDAEKIGTRGGHALIYGETGTGKTLLARHVHAASERRNGEMETLGAAATRSADPTIAQAMLFGRVKGYAAGRDDEGQVGVLAGLNDGILLLDDIQNLPLETQQLLLNFVEDGRYSPVGAGAYRPEHSNAWLICTVNRDPDTLEEEGRLGADFLARLRKCNPVLVVPTLADRGEGEVRAVARAFAGAVEGREITDECMELLAGLHYRDNIRDLEATIVQACAYSESEGRELTKEQVLRGLEKMEPKRRERLMKGMRSGFGPKLGPVERREAETVVAALNEHGSMRRAGRSLGKSKDWVARRVGLYGIRKKNDVWEVG